MKNFETLLLDHRRDIEFKGMAICDLTENCDECPLYSDCKRTGNRQERIGVYERLVSWALDDVKKSCKGKTSNESQTEIIFR